MLIRRVRRATLRYGERRGGDVLTNLASTRTLMKLVLGGVIVVGYTLDCAPFLTLSEVPRSSSSRAHSVGPS